MLPTLLILFVAAVQLPAQSTATSHSPSVETAATTSSAEEPTRSLKRALLTLWTPAEFAAGEAAPANAWTVRVIELNDSIRKSLPLVGAAESLSVATVANSTWKFNDGTECAVLQRDVSVIFRTQDGVVCAVVLSDPTHVDAETPLAEWSAFNRQLGANAESWKSLLPDPILSARAALEAVAKRRIINLWESKKIVMHAIVLESNSCGLSHNMWSIDVRGLSSVPKTPPRGLPDKYWNHLRFRVDANSGALCGMNNVPTVLAPNEPTPVIESPFHRPPGVILPPFVPTNSPPADRPGEYPIRSTNPR